LESHLVEAFRQRLRELGYTEGQNIAIDYRWAEGQDERLSELAADLVRLKVDIIVTGNTDSTLAARRATQTIPIVMVGTGDPVEAGLVASLARPEGNVTGLSTLRPDLEGKRLGLFTEAVPRLSRVAVLRDPGNPVAKSYLESIQAAAHASHVTLEPCWKSVA
jgi:putative ABC transport system substrate-binding protein